MALDPNYTAILSNAAQSDHDEIKRLREALSEIVKYTDADIHDWSKFASAQQTCRQIARRALKESSE